ncbi:hypothetical protein NEFER03_1144 [Nematocida sp. LUAm3]|nr:hypothetical protein NEFER03_1144 [Nematocida sp. LUAm3]KAI5176320.1 hypothetical protein NEFER02_2108 [Nematocida sp. LUAm2]KAI5178249.1 hypothetical protein NEFER01_1416 [Nematocida sp. LUAm1]
MQKRSRTRDLPIYQNKDIILTEELGIEHTLLSQVDPKSLLIVVDTPSSSYLARIKEDITNTYPNNSISLFTSQEDTPTQSEELPLSDIIISSFSEYFSLSNKTLQLKTHWIFMNIQNKLEKKKAIKHAEKLKHNIYFVSNIYKLEDINQLQRLGLRIIPKKEGFGWARSINAFGRFHEIVFAGAPHLKSSAFLIAMDRNATVPCIIAVEKEETIAHVRELLNSHSSPLREKETESIEEYVSKKKWVLLTSQKKLSSLIFSEDFQKIQSMTQSLVSYDCIARTSSLLAMHQLSKTIFSISTTADRGKAQKISQMLPVYGVNMGETAEAILKSVAPKTQEPAQKTLS